MDTWAREKQQLWCFSCRKMRKWREKVSGHCAPCPQPESFTVLLLFWQAEPWEQLESDRLRMTSLTLHFSLFPVSPAFNICPCHRSTPLCHRCCSCCALTVDVSMSVLFTVCFYKLLFVFIVSPCKTNNPHCFNTYWAFRRRCLPLLT